MLRPLALILALAAAPPGAARPARYLGARACAACHADIVRSWQGTAHARATAGLSRAEVASPRCQACHATGDAPAGTSALPGVECEACHGPGADYAPDDVMRDPLLARALGLADLSTPEARAALCRRCHLPAGATRLAPFDPVRAWRRIRHPAAAPAAAPAVP